MPETPAKLAPAFWGFLQQTITKLDEESADVKSDDDMKKLLRALSDAVNESLINSSAFVDAIAALWRAGQDASLSVNAPQADADGPPEVNAAIIDPPAALTLTADDEYFLRSLKIATPV